MKRTARYSIFLAAMVLAFASSVASAWAHEPIPQASHEAEQRKRAAAAMTEEEMRNVSARGFEDYLFTGKSIYFSNGTAVEVLGDTGMLLTVPPWLARNDLFQNLLFNPANLDTLVDRNGDALIRVSTYIDEVNFPDVRLNSGPSFGSITIRGIDLHGTTVRIARSH